MLQWRLSHTLNNPQTKTGEQEAGDDSEEVGVGAGCHVFPL